ncbi:MAG: roadblock/LC7 domain-containing protein [Thermoleophilia bacterium]
MGKNQTINTSQIDAATGILEKMRNSINPEFIGIISSGGLPVTVLSSSTKINPEVLASLAASSFAATSQLARVTNNATYAVMFHEGEDNNIHISQIGGDYLLVIIFANPSEIGKVRIISKRAREALAAALVQAENPILLKNRDAVVEETNIQSDERTRTGD